jgi:hypothetical protein
VVEPAKLLAGEPESVNVTVELRAVKVEIADFVQSPPTFTA